MTRFRWLPLVTTVILISSASRAMAGAVEPELKPEDLYKQVLPSVVTLVAEKNDGSTSTGTGFLALKDGLAVTAWHVLRGSKRVIARFSDGQEFEVSGLVDKDERRDVAVVRVKVAGRPLLPLFPGEPEAGSKAFVIGTPKGLDFSITDGLVNRVRSEGGSKLVQFSCPVSPGNSGSPLLNARGEVVGIVSFAFKDGQNLNFAVHSTYAQGLDSTLPTTRWADVRNEEPVVAAGDLDRLLVRACIAFRNALTAVQYLEREIAGKPRGFRRGVPAFVYSIQGECRKVAGDLAATEAEGSVRADVVAAYQVTLAATAQYIELAARAILLAQEADGWSPAANDVMNRARAARGDLSLPEKEAQLLRSDTFVAALPIELRYTLGALPDESGFRLGVNSIVGEPLVFTVVHKDLLADKLGFRSGDRVIAVATNPVRTAQELKLALRAAAGTKLPVQIRRDGKEVTLSLKVPKDLEPFK